MVESGRRSEKTPPAISDAPVRMRGRAEFLPLIFYARVSVEGEGNGVRGGS